MLNTVRRFIISIFAAALVLVGGIAIAPVAQAGAYCDVTGTCGTIHHDSSSLVAYLNVSTTWPTVNWKTIPRGQTSARMGAAFKDVDGYWVPAGYRAWAQRANSTWYVLAGPGWHKISDTQKLRIAIRR